MPNFPSVIRLPEVVRRTGKSRSSIYSDMTKGQFPRPVDIGTRARGWIEDDIALWIIKTMRERDHLFGKQFSTLQMRVDHMPNVGSVIRLPEVIRRVSKSRSSIYSDVANGLFPRPVSIGMHAKGWIEGEIALWVSEKIRARNQSYGKQHSSHGHLSRTVHDSRVGSPS
jgi:prophage regulatory protein